MSGHNADKINGVRNIVIGSVAKSVVLKPLALKSSNVKCVSSYCFLLLECYKTYGSSNLIVFEILRNQWF